MVGGVTWIIQVFSVWSQTLKKEGKEGGGRGGARGGMSAECYLKTQEGSHELRNESGL